MTATKPQGYMACVLPGRWGWTVSCSCGYLVTGQPTQGLAHADMENHVARCHPPKDDDG